MTASDVRRDESEAWWVTVRPHLTKQWLAAHRGWGDPPPHPLSRHMCRYTAEFVTLVNPRWAVVLGLVDGETHAWTERPGGFLDLTGDQFGRPEVQMAAARPAGYAPIRWTDSPAGPYRHRARLWLPHVLAELERRT